MLVDFRRSFSAFPESWNGKVSSTLDAWLEAFGRKIPPSGGGSLNLKPTIIREFLAEESPLDAFLPMHSAMPNASLVALR